MAVSKDRFQKGSGSRNLMAEVSGPHRNNVKAGEAKGTHFKVNSAVYDADGRLLKGSAAKSSAKYSTAEEAKEAGFNTAELWARHHL